MGEKFFCVKFQKEMPGLEEPPFEGHPIGQKIFDNVFERSLEDVDRAHEDAHERVSAQPGHARIARVPHQNRWNDYFFGAGSALPPDFVAAKAK